ncbi:hypothetical protein ASE00_01540 [Sphingomonas sp. Root710]|nr:hypothetical protein ASE00_01540 [Sphingomonas sp. Root710]
MAFLHSEVPPSTAPVQTRPAGPAVRIAAPSTRQPRNPGRRLGRVAAVFGGIALLVIPGHLAARATDSLAIGILAADFVFLMAVAAWSAVASGARR